MNGMLLITALSLTGPCPDCRDETAAAVRQPTPPPPPVSVTDRVAALEGRLSAVESDVRQVKQTAAETAAGIGRIERALADQRPPATPPAVAAEKPKTTEELLASIDAKLSVLINQRAAAVQPVTIPAAVRGAVAPAPFAPAGAAPFTTLPTPVPGAGQVSSWSQDGTPLVTYTLAPGAGFSGGTSGGCSAAGGCAAPQAGRVGLFGRLRR